MRVALVTYTHLPDLDVDDQRLFEPLRIRGIDAVAATWDDPTVDWDTFDLVILRSTWDYPRRQDEFLAWTRTVPRLANPATIVEWNTNKSYLQMLSSAGPPVIPTTWLEPGSNVVLPTSGEYVIKPAVGNDAIDAGRYLLDDRALRKLAEAHVARLLDRGVTAMLQPYLSGVDTAGETAMIHIGGSFSHAVNKSAILDGPDDGASVPATGFQIRPHEPSATERAAAKIAMDAIATRFGNDILYARIDLIPDDDGSPIILELELIEPSLFLGYAPHATDRLAEAIAVRLGK